ncbi:MAG: copper homeostasis protein CutC [bacterium]|nr:copper homeostasis protein CutC [bacterium]
MSPAAATGPLVEVCLDSAESAVAAEEGGAHRVELCAGLVEGGITPSAGTIHTTRRSIDIGLQVMIRPRGGDFCYSPTEVEIMLRDLEVAREAGADGVVFGALLPDGRTDAELTARLIAASRPMSVTFHRAFDMTRDPSEALETLIELGIDRVLTSGQEAGVMEGLELVAELIRKAGDRIVVMPGCGITPRNLGQVLRATGAREVHVVGTEAVDSPMRYRNPRCFMGTALHTPEYRREVTSPERVRAFLSPTGA